MTQRIVLITLRPAIHNVIIINSHEKTKNKT
jgi:hypothetical protein